MTVTEILKIANDDHLMFMLTTISESIKNDYYIYEMGNILGLYILE